MPKRKVLTTFEKGQITALKSEGKSVRFIAAAINRSKTAVFQFLNGSATKALKKRGKKFKISERSGRLLCREVTNRLTTASKTAKLLNLPVSRWTINRYIGRNVTLCRRIANRLPRLTRLHQVNRVRWAKENFKRDWTTVCFSDEKSLT